ncbi:LysR family transcriptional regulator [Pseudomonas sp. S31]|uniref:LysR substrate-binding domain-containing protein n=1 Tax=Pseudomonas sp. S31 TaxID=1564473 RepID=UPI00191491E2|nr:LysR substrate-binding domain-containing protein [Pseudomonas sp. S31]MBK5002378.1 LysR family transcriptional regulator [Pseudomonas sp. S31]
MALDRLEAMRAFCRIVEVGSFSAAAESLGVAKTTISGQVQALETLLGIKLLHRSTRKVSPTTEGAAYYQRARAVIDDVDELEASVAQSRNVVRGRVRIEMPSPVGIWFVVPALGDFTARFPEIHLDIGCSERVVDLVQEGVDCAIRGGVIADQDLVCRPIGQMRFCFCASPAYLASAGPLQSPADLHRHKHFGFKFPATDRRFVPVLTRGEQRFTLDQPPSMYFNNGSATAAAAVAGLGVAFLPAAAAKPHFTSGALVQVLSDWQMASMPLSVVFPYTRHLSARVRAFTDWVTTRMANDPLWSL